MTKCLHPADALDGHTLMWRITLTDGRQFEYWTRGFANALRLLFGETGGWRNGIPVLTAGLEEVAAYSPLPSHA